MRLLLAGDTHGSKRWVSQVVHIAEKVGADWIVQVGDFGFFPHTEGGKQYLNHVCAELTLAGLRMLWIDGNHDNHDWLAIQTHDENGWWELGDGVLVHAARGSRWEWDGVKFLACGGAYSIDKEWRLAKMAEGAPPMWWAGETITDTDVLACADAPTDVLFCHDAPTCAQGAIPVAGTWDRQKDNWPDSRANREQLQKIVDKVRPQLVVHGHYHHRNSETTYNDVQVEGLDRDGFIESLLVLDLATLVLRPVTHKEFRG